MTDSESELVIESDLEEESLTRDVESLRQLLESEANPTIKQVSTEEDGSTLEQLKDCLQKNRDLQSALSRYLSEVDTALQQNRKKREQVQTGGRDYIHTICTLHKMRRRRIYFVDNTGKSPFIPAVVNPPCLTRNYYFHDNKWWPQDDSRLKKHVTAQAIEVANRPLEEQLSKTQDKEEIATLKQKMREISSAFSSDSAAMLKDVDPDQIMWENVAYEGFKKRRTGVDCRQRWVIHLCPAVNNSSWTKEEETVVMKEGKKLEGRDWKKIATIVGNGRSPYSCFKVYQNAFFNSKKSTWSKECDEKLREAVEKYGADSWLAVSRFVGQSVRMCRSRWNTFLSPSIRKGRWNPPEDKLLQEAVKKYGTSDIKCWKKISSMVPGRNGTQCRERWVNILNPDINAGQFTLQENRKLLKLCSEYEKKGIPIAWSRVAQELPNRTDSKCSNQWHRLTTPDRIMKNSTLSKMKEKIKTKVKGRKSQLALDFKDFDDDMIPEQLKAEAKSYGATLTEKKMKRMSSKTMTTFHSYFAGEGNPFPAGPRFITGIVNSQSNGSQSSPMYLTSMISSAGTSTDQLSSMEVLQSLSSATMSPVSSATRTVLVTPLPISHPSSNPRSHRPVATVSSSAAVSSLSEVVSSSSSPAVQSGPVNSLPPALSAISSRTRSSVVRSGTPISSSATASSSSLTVSSSSSSSPLLLTSFPPSIPSISSRTRSLVQRGSTRSSCALMRSSSLAVPSTASLASSPVLPALSSTSTRSVQRRGCTTSSAARTSSSVSSAVQVSTPFMMVPSSISSPSVPSTTTSTATMSVLPVTTVSLPAAVDNSSPSISTRPLILHHSSRHPTIPSTSLANRITSQVPRRPSILPSHAFHSSDTQSVSMSVVSTLAKALVSSESTDAEPSLPQASSSDAQPASASVFSALAKALVSANNSVAEPGSPSDVFSSAAARLVKKFLIHRLPRSGVETSTTPAAGSEQEKSNLQNSSSQNQEQCNENLSEPSSSTSAAKDATQATTSRRRRKQLHSPHKMVSETVDPEVASPAAKRPKTLSKSSKTQRRPKKKQCTQ